MLKKTPLYDLHKSLDARMIPFAGWEMPVQYTSIIEEHLAVRETVGVFDVSHMGEIEVRGPQAFDFLQYCITNDLSRIQDYQAIYSPICNEDGGTVDDLLVYRFNSTRFLVVVNAANIEKDYDWFLKVRAAKNFSVQIDNLSENYIQIAVQGPEAEMLLQPYAAISLSEIKFYHFTEGRIFGFPAIISRTGYTGEDGFELYVFPEYGIKIWQKLIELGVKPCGLGARDTLRLESGLALYGNDLADDIKPTETIIRWTVKLDKGDFVGKAQLQQPPKRKMYGFEMLEAGIPRHSYKVWYEGEEIGYVTSGSYAPYLKKNIGLCLVTALDLKEGDILEVEIRGHRRKARIVKLPFYTKKYKK